MSHTNTQVHSDTLISGFSDPVQQAQQVFRALLKAMSEPGNLMQCNFTDQAPNGLDSASWQLALTLLDADTTVWLSPSLAKNHSVTSNLRFHCQCPIIEDSQIADFAIALASELPRLDDLNGGDPEYPDRSTTLIVQVTALSNEPFWTLTGPGIETRHNLRIAGLPKQFRDNMITNRSRFPLGIDTIYSCGTSLTALPRTTFIKEEGC
jgi:alpha-D-ribose 1-methylphosphonate 5-triphosphate synthase subunit PhnH